MGFFSWKTQDTDRSIHNKYTGKKTFKVIMTDNEGNQWVENDYEGYGEFDGKDYYALTDEMNGGDGDRLRGINLYFSKERDKYKFPSLSENGDYYNKRPEDCEYQGYFYDEVCQDFYASENIDELKDKLL